MFTETLAQVLEDYDFETSSETETTLTSNLRDEDVKLDVNVDVDGDDRTVTVKITHPDGEQRFVFHSCEDSEYELAKVIADECNYWSEN